MDNQDSDKNSISINDENEPEKKSLKSEIEISSLKLESTENVSKPPKTSKKKSKKKLTKKVLKQRFPTEESLTDPESKDKTPNITSEKGLFVEPENNSSISAPNESSSRPEPEEGSSRTEPEESLTKHESNKSLIRSQSDIMETKMSTSKKRLLNMIASETSVIEDIEEPAFAGQTIENDLIGGTIGEFGSSQLILLLLMNVARITISMHKQASTYIQTPVNMTCAEYLNHTRIENVPIFIHFKQNVFMEESVCKHLHNCTVIFDHSVFGETIVTEFKLICSRYYLSDLQHTILMFGSTIGSLLFGYTASKFGRYYTFIISAIITSVAGLFVTLSPTVRFLTLSRFLCGVGIAGLLTGYLLLLESIGNKYRFVVSVVYQFGYAMGVILSSVFAYLLRNWRLWYLSLSSPLGLLILIYILKLKESPRWLLLKGEVGKCTTTLESIAKTNKMPTEHISDVVNNAYKKFSKLILAEDKQYLTLFRRKLVFRTITLCFAYLTNAITSYGSSNYYKPMDDTVFTFNFVLGLALLPGTLIAIVLSKLLTLKSIAFYTAILLMTTIVLRFILAESANGQFTLASIFNFFQMIFQTALMLLVAHLFPTTLRSQAHGLIQAAATMGSMVAPYPLHLDQLDKLGPMVLYFFLWCICVVLMQWYIPDDLGAHLPDTISEIKPTKNECCVIPNNRNKNDGVSSDD